MNFICSSRFDSRHSLAWRDHLCGSVSTPNNRPAWQSKTTDTLVVLGKHCRDKILRIYASFNLSRGCMCRAELGRGRITRPGIKVKKSCHRCTGSTGCCRRCQVANKSTTLQDHSTYSTPLRQAGGRLVASRKHSGTQQIPNTLATSWRQVGGKSSCSPASYNLVRNGK